MNKVIPNRLRRFNQTIANLCLLPSKIKRNRLVAAIRVGVASIAFASIVLTSFYAYQIWQKQNETIQNVSFTRVEIKPLGFETAEQSLTRKRIGELAISSDAVLAYPKISLCVQVAVPSQTTEVGFQSVEYATLEGITGTEPDLKVAWVNESETRIGYEIVLSDTLYRSLTNDSDWESLSEPQIAVVTIRRDVDGQVQEESFEVAIAGICKNPSSKVFCDLNLALHLDQWQRHRAQSIWEEESSLAQSQSNLEESETIFAGAVFFSSSSSNVESMINKFESYGFQTIHNLDLLHEMFELTVTLTLLVILLVSGAVANAVLNIFLTSWLELVAKKREYGIKLSYGVSRFQILISNLVEMSLILLCSATFGLLFVLATEPLLTKLLIAKTGLDSVLDGVSMYSISSVWIVLIAFTVLLVVGLLGSLVPTTALLRQRTIDLLQR